MRLAFPLLLTTFTLFAGVSPSALAKGAAAKPGAAKAPEWTEDGGRQVLNVFDPSPLKAYVSAPSAPEAGKKAELIIVLHGHGGTATGMLGYTQPIAEGRKAYCMACEGSGVIKTDKGDGHSWSDPDIKGILACLDAALLKFAIDPKRVVIMGHSAGGTMSLETYAARPTAFAGIYTTAAPMTPSSAQKGARIVVNLGMKDPNYQGFPAAVNASQKTVVGRVVAVEDLAHDLPNATYSEEAIAWILDSKAPSETLRLPFDPAGEIAAPADSPAAKAKGGKFRHVLRFMAGGRGAPADALPAAGLKATMAALGKAMKEKLSDATLEVWKLFPDSIGKLPKSLDVDVADLAATVSQDPLTKDLRGLITGAVLARYGGPLLAAMTKLRGGEISAPVESDAGWHLVFRDP